MQSEQWIEWSDYKEQSPFLNTFFVMKHNIIGTIVIKSWDENKWPGIIQYNRGKGSKMGILAE